MSHERTPPAVPELKPGEGFGFTEQEKLDDRVSDERFKTFLNDPHTTIHQVDESTNNYGEFLFVTVSRPIGDEKRECATFFGYGYHEHRERWFTNEWLWYRANQFPETMRQQLTREEAKELLQQRRRWITPFITEEPQSDHARLFEFLADLTDEDGALTEIEDLEDLGRWLLDDIY
jgi:hypothetical protein